MKILAAWQWRNCRSIQYFFSAAIVSMTVLSSGCGFHLHSRTVSPLPVDYQHLQLALAPEAAVLRQPLSNYLRNLGISDDDSTATVLNVHRFHLYRQPLSGKLTEVQLRLVAEFSLYRNGQPLTAPRTIVAQRSYQYDRATVNTDNQEESYLIGVMQDDVAQQIVRLLRTGRLPKPDARTLDQAP